MLGYAAEEMIGRQTPAILHLEAEINARGEELMRQLGRPVVGMDVFLEPARRGDVNEREWTLVCKDGSRLIANLVLTPMCDRKGKIIGVTGIVRDITEQKRAEEVLRQRIELQDQLAKIAASVPGVIYSFRLRTDGSSCMPFAVAAVEDMFGIPREVLAQDMTPLLANVHPDDLQHLIDSIAEASILPSDWRHTHRYLHPAKGLRWIEGWSAPQSQVEPDGSVVWHGFLMDVTERKHVDEELRESQAKLQAIVNTVMDAIIAIDLSDTVLSFNPAAERIFGFAAD